MKKTTSITAFICCFALAIGLSSFVNHKKPLDHTIQNLYASCYYSGGATYVYLTWTDAAQGYVMINGNAYGYRTPGASIQISSTILPSCTGQSVVVWGPCVTCGVASAYPTTPGSCPIHIDPCDVCPD
jgi:hypothetical protein